MNDPLIPFTAFELDKIKQALISLDTGRMYNNLIEMINYKQRMWHEDEYENNDYIVRGSMYMIHYKCDRPDFEHMEEIGQMIDKDYETRMLK